MVAKKGTGRKTRISPPRGPLTGVPRRRGTVFHRRDAETRRKNARSKPESAEEAESAEKSWHSARTAPRLGSGVIRFHGRKKGTGRKTRISPPRGPLTGVPRRRGTVFHRRDAETRRKNARSKPESAEEAESAENSAAERLKEPCRVCFRTRKDFEFLGLGTELASFRKIIGGNPGGFAVTVGAFRFQQ